MFRSLLLAIDHSEYSYVTTRYAIEWARGLSAHLTILSVLDKKELAVVYPFIFPMDEVALDFDPEKLGGELRDRQMAQAQKAIEKAEKACAEAGVRCTSHTEEGIVARVILKYAVDADLLLIGQRGSGAEHSTGLLGSNLESVIRQVHRPVLIAPHTYRPLSRILLAYDGSASASEAKHTIVGICESFQASMKSPGGTSQFKLLVVDDDRDRAEKVAARAESYLSAYDLGQEVIYATGEPAEQILGTADRIDADLVTMGAYGHSRVHEMLLGSTTEQVLRQIERPVLLIH